jgi:hypothetical protein
MWLLVLVDSRTTSEGLRGVRVLIAVATPFQHAYYHPEYGEIEGSAVRASTSREGEQQA